MRGHTIYKTANSRSEAVVSGHSLATHRIRLYVSVCVYIWMMLYGTHHMYRIPQSKEWWVLDVICEPL